MQKPIFLGLVLVFTGCQAFKKSDTWSQVIKHRVDTRGVGNPSEFYAEALSRELAASRVEHRVVTYQYRIRPRLREEGVAQRTAVIYKDPAHPDYPWWLKDNLSARPVWLPNTEVSRQVAFYAQREIEIIDARGMAAPDAKGTVAEARKIESTMRNAPGQPERLILKKSRAQTARERSRLLASLQKVWQSIFHPQRGSALDRGDAGERTEIHEVASR